MYSKGVPLRSEVIDADDDIVVDSLIAHPDPKEAPFEKTLESELTVCIQERAGDLYPDKEYGRTGDNIMGVL